MTRFLLWVGTACLAVAVVMPTAFAARRMTERVFGHFASPSGFLAAFLIQLAIVAIPIAILYWILQRWFPTVRTHHGANLPAELSLPFPMEPVPVAPHRPDAALHPRRTRHPHDAQFAGWIGVMVGSVVLVMAATAAFTFVPLLFVKGWGLYG